MKGATLGLAKIVGSCWALTYLALVVGNPKFQTMLDPSLLPVEGTPATAVPAIGVSGGGGGGRGGIADSGIGDATDGPRERVDVDDHAAAAVDGGGRGFGVVGAFGRWAEGRGRRRDSRRRRRRRGRACGDELESSGGRARVAAPMLVRARK